jgi:hypothetical protein
LDSVYELTHYARSSQQCRAIRSGGNPIDRVVIYAANGDRGDCIVPLLSAVGDGGTFLIIFQLVGPVTFRHTVMA